MIPARWMVLGDMPHNGNGKIDRTLVKERFRQAVDGQGHTVAQEPSQPAYIDARKALLDTR
jgi:acyl-CoA synthetase (AMP-forming)/AMP-acid ligase II